MEIKLLLVIIQAACVWTADQVITDNVTDIALGDRLDGDAVIDVGNSLESPLIKLIGTALKNLEGEIKTKLMKVLCRLPSCLEWSEWTECVYEIDNYGIRNRTRICGQFDDDASCAYPQKPGNTSEYETSLCELQIRNDSEAHSCSNNYTKTEHGLCVKLYTDIASWNDAQSNCENDGGNLINIDSTEKSQDIAKTFTTLALNTVVLIDGVRNSLGSDWEVKSGAKNMFSNWHIGEPNETRFPACRYAKREHETDEWKWYDSYPCTGVGIYICEIGP